MASAPPRLKPAAISVNNQPTSPPLLQQQQQSTTQQAKNDVTILNPPAHAARQGVSQIFDVLLSGTPFIRQLLLQETEVIYECRACRALFRGLLNFVDHKKNYCTMRVGVENAIAAQSSAPTGLQRWACQDKEPIPIIEPEAPEEEAAQTNVKSNKKVSVNLKPKQQMVIRKPDNTYILVRPIPGTTRAMEQMIIRPEQVLYQSQLDTLSNFKKQGQESDGTAKLVGEIAIRQAKNAAKKAQSSPTPEETSGNKKRETLHSLLKNVKGSSSPVNMISNSPSKSAMLSSKGRHGGASSSKQVMMVTLGQQKKLAAKQQQQPGKKAICKVCKKECKNFTALAWHERVHKKLNFKCELCLSATKSLYNLKRHLSTVHHLSPSKVDSVVRNRDQKLKVQLHNARLTQQKKAGKKLSSPSDDESEDEEEDNDEDGTSDTPTCPICQKTFASQRNVKRHMKIHQRQDAKLREQLEDAEQQKEEEEMDSSSEDESEEEEEEDDDETSDEEDDDGTQCTICRRKFASKRNVKRHMEIHRREGQIVSNGKLSSEQIAKNRVLQIMDEKNLRCRKCHKQLSGIRRLQQHCCNHFRLNRYRCSQCQYENVDYTQMRRHVMGKHGRHPQFRTIHLISKAIRKMKVGLWINLIINNEVDDTHSTSMLHSKRDSAKKNPIEGIKKVECNKKGEGTQKVAADRNGEASKLEKSEMASDKSKNADTNKGQVKVSMPVVMVERASRSRESRDSSSDHGADPTSISRASPVPLSSIKPKIIGKKEPETPSTSSKTTSTIKPKAIVRKEAEMPPAASKTTEIVLRNSSSRSSSPASARKPVVPESPKRETPIRQARLNHRSISSRLAQNLNLENEEDTPTTNGANEALVLMDKRQNRCMECNKQFQYTSSLRRHVQIHVEQKNAQKMSSSTPPKTTPKSTPGNKGNIDSFINFGQLKCTKCRKRFSNMSALKRHVGRHLGYTTFYCKYCDYISHSYTWFKKHLVLNHQHNVKNVGSIGKLMASMRVKKRK